MSITILCTGAPEHAIGGKYSSAGFDAAVQAERNSNIVPYGGRKHDPAGRTVLVGEDPLARRTAEPGRSSSPNCWTACGFTTTSSSVPES